MKTERNWIPTWYNLIMVVVVMLNCRTTQKSVNMSQQFEVENTDLRIKYSQLQRSHIKRQEASIIQFKIILAQQDYISTILSATKTGAMSVKQGNELLTCSNRIEALFDTLKRY